MIHTVKCFGTVNEGEVDVLLEFPCFLWDTTNVGNLISGSSAFSKSSFWIFSVHVMMKLSLKDFQHYLASMWNKSNWVVIEHSLALIFFEIEMKTDFFQSCGQCFVFQIYWHMECSTLTALSFRILSNSAGIPSPPLTLLVVMLPFSITVIPSLCPNQCAEEAKIWTVLWRPIKPNTQRRCPFHYRGLECKSRKSGDTRSNRQIWPWSTKQSRPKANRFAKRMHWS